MKVRLQVLVWSALNVLETVGEMRGVSVTYYHVVFCDFLLNFLHRVHPRNSSVAAVRRPGTRIAVVHNHQLQMVIIRSGFKRGIFFFHCAEYMHQL